MGFRMRKSFKIGKAGRVTLSKSGVGFSVGGKGIRLTKTAKGTVRKTVSIPGTGISHVSESSMKKKRSTKAQTTSQSTGLSHTAQESASVPFEEQLANYRIPGKKSIVWAIILMLFTMGNPPLFVAAVALLVYGIKQYKSPKTQLAKSHNAAILFFRTKQYGSALQEAQKALELSDTDPFMNFIAGYCAMQLNEFEKACIYLNSFYEKHPDDYTSMLLGMCYYSTESYENAVPHLQRALSSDPGEQLDLLIMLGKCFFELEQYETAIQVFERGPIRKRKLDDKIKELLYWLAFSYYKLGNKKKAKQLFTRIYGADIHYKNVATVLREFS